MDFLDPKKKRSHRLRLFIGYGLMAIVLAMATTIFVFEAYGFGVDRETGEVIQNGLVFVDAHPEAAQVFLNDESQGTTDARLVIPAGDYTVRLERDGYRTWERSFSLKGGSIERLVYPFLFPSDLESQDSQLYSETPALATQSPDRRWLVVQQPNSLRNFQVIDLNTDNQRTESITIPAGVLASSTDKTQDLELVEWSTDNRHVILKHSFEDETEFIRLDIQQPAESININEELDISPTQIVLRDKKFDQLYIYNSKDDVLRQGNLSSGSITPLLTDVLAFKTHGAEEVLYVTDQGTDKGEVAVKIRTPNKIYDLRDLPGNTKSQYLLEIARFDDSWYVAAGAASEKKVYIYRDPTAVLDRSREDSPSVAVPVSILRTPSKPRFLTFSANARFIAAQAGSAFSVYDAEFDDQYQYDLELDIPANQKATWMDGHRLTVISEGELQVFDFNGINLQALVEANAQFTPFFDRDYNQLYTISPSTAVPGRSALVETEMRIGSDR